jgi:cytochrome c oxidase cbb3-type subunit II
MSQKHDNFIHRIDKSAVITVIGVIFLFSFAVGITLIAPGYMDHTWTQPTSPYQVQMYEVSDPNFYISSSTAENPELQFVNHIQDGKSLLAFHENDALRIVAPPSLEKYITRMDEDKLKLTTRVLLLRKPQSKQDSFNAVAQSEALKKQLQQNWEKQNPKWKEEGLIIPELEILELYDPGMKEAFTVASPDAIVENWLDSGKFIILEGNQHQAHHSDSGVIYHHNPIEFRISPYIFADRRGWRYDPNGEAIEDVNQLKSHSLGFRSRQELIKLGEHIYAIEGCWYCHTDQTRTLVQDVVLNGGDSYPAPPSSANEYIYQAITFPGTRRIGPDISRTGVKRPSRDWHKGHFWSPKTASKGSIMPAMRHFFDDDPRGTAVNPTGIPNYQFEALYQYLMTKGTRITPPTQAWWLGKDPIQTKEIIEGKRKLP